jgi:hypothetical protein
MNLMLPFASKDLPNGKRLYRRTNGMTLTLPSSDSIVVSYTCPYAQAKINEVEVLWCPEGVTAQMRVKDTAAGTYSTVPNAVLDTFGSAVNIAKDYWKGRSEYDADIYGGMVLEFSITNLSSESKLVGINMVFHEVI